jgi:transcriptional regulator with XRE-family HTH domain
MAKQPSRRVKDLTLSERLRYERIGHRIQAHRLLRSLTRNELGEMVGRTGSVIGRYERGEAAIDVHMLFRIAHALRCGVVTLWS